MGMEFGGFCKKKNLLGSGEREGKRGGTFASVILTVSGKSIPIATTKTVTIACIYQKVTRFISWELVVFMPPRRLPVVRGPVALIIDSTLTLTNLLDAHDSGVSVQFKE